MVFSPTTKIDRQMAVLNSIRKRGIFLILIIALALFAFILSDILTRGGGGSVENTIATVNGTEIERQDFMEQVEVTQRSLGPNAAPTQAMNIVWDRRLRSTLMSQQYEELGLTAEAAHVNDALSTYLAGNPTFQDEAGNYSEQKMLEYVALIKENAATNPGPYQQWLDYIVGLKETILQDKYINMLRGGLTTTLSEGEFQYHYENDKVNIQYVQIPFSSIADAEIEVSEQEIAQYIKDNPKQYEVDPQIDIQYVLVEEKASQQDIDDYKAEMASLLESRIEFNNITRQNDTLPGFGAVSKVAEFVNANSDKAYQDRWYFEGQLPQAAADTLWSLGEGAVYGPYQQDNTLNISRVLEVRQLPDSAKVRHILVPIGFNPTDSITRTDAEAKKAADSILAILKSDRSKFPDIVKSTSSDNGSIDNGGRYDWFPYNQMVPAFRDFSFEKPVGELGIAKTRFGYHIIEVEGQKDFKNAMKVATITKEIEPSETTMNEVFSKATNFEIKALEGDFNAVATEQGLAVRPVNKVGEMDSNIPGIGNFRPVVTWGFNEETEVGDVSRFNVPQGYVIAQLTRRSPKGLMSVADASALVTPTIRNDKKAERIIAGATGTTLEEIASSQGVTVQTASAITMALPTIPGAGNEPEVVGAAFGTKPGETTDFIRGKSGVFKVRVTAFNEAPALDNYTSYVNQLNGQVGPNLNNSVFNALREKADIEDNRAKFY
jgi:parvulin-like peptidyl-prolyl isomerase